MPEDRCEQVEATFSTGLPLGTHARFKHNNEWWIAYPASKNTRILAGIDRMIAKFGVIERDMVRWLNDHPADSKWPLMILSHISEARRWARYETFEKTEARTM